MKILHYTLGFAPSRTGGLVKYVSDIIDEEVEQNHEVIALYPGRINILDRQMRIKEKKELNLKYIKFEIINSLPLPLFGGIKTPNDFMKKSPEGLFEKFLEKIKPDIIHVHTLMGIPKEFFLVAKRMNIKIVYTSHDYFGIAPEPTFYFNNKNYDDNNTIEKWIEISQLAMGTKKIRVFQLSFYPKIRKTLKVLKKGKKDVSYVSEPNKSFNNNRRKDEFIELRNYYKEILCSIDKFHFNSNLAKSVYIKNLKELASKDNEVISITNRTIKRNEKIEKNEDKISIGYIGQDQGFKGYFDFLRLVSLLDCKRYEFHTFGYEPISEVPQVTQHGRYSANKLTDVYKYIDILIVPSRCKETFGFVVLEGLSYGAKVFVSQNVGAKDLISTDYQFSNLNILAEKIEKAMDGNLPEQIVNLKNEKQHVRELVKFYKS